MYRKLDDLAGELRQAGLSRVTVGLNPENGEVEFVTKIDPAAIQAAVENGAITVPDGYKVTRDEIIGAASLSGGRAYNVDPSSNCGDLCGGTTGFSLISTSNSTRYVSTAGHVADGRARYNNSLSSQYSSGGVALTVAQDLLKTVKLDIQYGAPSSPDTNFPTPISGTEASINL